MSAEIIDLADRRRAREARFYRPWPLVLLICAEVWLGLALLTWRFLSFD